jgi:predicted Fe-Mo cluster-binding NifX family protein
LEKELVNMNTLIAVPSELPGGLEAAVGAHFGHCEMYTLVLVQDNEIQNIQVVPNLPHEQGGCMAPVNYLAQQGVKALIAGGMGLRPLMGFNQVGIDVFHSGGASTVKEAITAILDQKLVKFGQEHTCGGGGNQHDHSCGNHH